MGFFRTEADEGGRLYSRRELRAMIEELQERIEEEEARKEELLFEIECVDESIASLSAELADLRYSLA